MSLEQQPLRVSWLFKTIPMGTKYMFTTQCSKPEATKAVIGKTKARILSTVLRALKLSQTARITGILHRIPRKNEIWKQKPQLVVKILMFVLIACTLNDSICLLTCSVNKAGGSSKICNWGAVWNLGAFGLNHSVEYWASLKYIILK